MEENKEQLSEQSQEILNEESPSTVETSDVSSKESDTFDGDESPVEKPQVDSLSQSASEPVAPIESVTIDEVQKQMVTIEEQMATLHEKFDKKIAYDEYKNTLFDRLYSELESYKNGLYSKLLEPFVKETILLINEYLRQIDHIEGMEHDALVGFVKGIPGDLEDLLENNGVECYEDDTVRFNPKTQRVKSILPTGDPQADKVIAEHVQKGYRLNGVILKREMVSIYKYMEQQDSTISEMSGEASESQA